MSMNREQAGKLINKRNALIDRLEKFAESLKHSQAKPGTVDFLVAQALLIGMQMEGVCIRAEMKEARL